MTANKNAQADFDTSDTSRAEMLNFFGMKVLYEGMHVPSKLFIHTMLQFFKR